MSEDEEAKDEVAEYYGLDLTKYRQDDEIGGEPDAAPAEEEQEDEQDEEVEAEEADEDDPDESDEGEGDEPEPEEKPDPKSDLVDKQLQKFQQLNATLEKKLAALPEEGEPTAKQVKEVEKAKSRIEKYLEESDDLDPYKGVVDLANEMSGDKSQMAKLADQLESLQQYVEESNVRIRAEQAQARFASYYPDLAGRYEELAQKAHEAVVDTVGASMSRLAEEDYERAANKFFLQLVEQETKKSASKAAPEKPKSGAKKPQGSRIIKKKSGSSSKMGSDDPEAAMAAIRAKWES